MADGVIFDMDGVLVASGRAHDASWKMLAKSRGLSITSEQFAATFGKSSREIIRTLWGESIPDADVRAMDDRKEELYRELITGLVPLTVGVRETLWHLQQAGYSLAVGTSGPRANVDLVLRETGMEGFFAAIATGEDVRHGKPAPDVFLLAAERLRIEPSRCVVIEDAPVGVAAAKAAGMPVIGFVGTHPAETLRAAGVDHVATHMRDITPDVVASLLQK